MGNNMKNETYLTFVKKLSNGAELHRNTEGFLLKLNGETMEFEIRKNMGEKLRISLFTHWAENGLYYEVYAKEVGLVALNRELQQEFFEERGGGANFPWSPPGTFQKQDNKGVKN
jgi:hypothetical protein